MLYENAVAVELGDAGRARQPRVDTTGLSAERRARMFIDVARAHAQRRQIHEAVAVLREAEKIAPEQVRNRDLIRQLVSDLLTMQDASASEPCDLPDIKRSSSPAYLGRWRRPGWSRFRASR